jgi:hypothetical protein
VHLKGATLNCDPHAETVGYTDTSALRPAIGGFDGHHGVGHVLGGQGERDANGRSLLIGSVEPDGYRSNI